MDAEQRDGERARAAIAEGVAAMVEHMSQLAAHRATMEASLREALADANESESTARLQRMWMSSESEATRVAEAAARVLRHAEGLLESTTAAAAARDAADRARAYARAVERAAWPVAHRARARMRAQQSIAEADALDAACQACNNQIAAAAEVALGRAVTMRPSGMRAQQ